jgi:hypothetical protein
VASPPPPATGCTWAPGPARSPSASRRAGHGGDHARRALRRPGPGRASGAGCQHEGAATPGPAMPPAAERSNGSGEAPRIALAMGPAAHPRQGRSSARRRAPEQAPVRWDACGLAAAQAQLLSGEVAGNVGHCLGGEAGEAGARVCPPDPQPAWPGRLAADLHPAGRLLGKSAGTICHSTKDSATR